MDKDVYEYMLDGDEECAQLWEEMIAKGDDAYKADSLEELAKIMDVDKDLFLAQVKQYNANVEAGVDADFGKDAEYLMPIATPPFYCGLIRGALEGLYSGGVKTDRQFRPVLEAGGVMENVFAIGLDGIMLYRDVYPMDVPGSASAECLNGGRVAANRAHELLRG